MKMLVDTHVHTNLSNHAYSTIDECARYARLHQLEGIVMADHLNDDISYDILASLLNREVLPSNIYGVQIIRGIEVDIIDVNAHLSGEDTKCMFNTEKNVCEAVLDTSDIVIASVHSTYKGGNLLANTNMFTKILEDPRVNIIGHCIKSNISFEIKEVVNAARIFGKPLEINESTFSNKEKIKYIYELLECCAEEDTMIAIGSDAHCAYDIGRFHKVNSILSEVEFPETLIVNKKLIEFLKYMGGRYE